MFCITYDTTCYADPQRAFDSFMRQLREFLGLAPRVRRNKRIVSHPQPHKVGKYRAPHLRPDPHPHLPRDRLQEYHSEPEIPPEGSCSRADEAQDDSDTDNTDEGDHLCKKCFWWIPYAGYYIAVLLRELKVWQKLLLSTPQPAKLKCRTRRSTSASLASEKSKGNTSELRAAPIRA